MRKEHRKIEQRKCGSHFRSNRKGISHGFHRDFAPISHRCSKLKQNLKGEPNGALHSLLATGLVAGTEKGRRSGTDQGGAWQYPFQNALYCLR